MLPTSSRQLGQMYPVFYADNTGEAPKGKPRTTTFLFSRAAHGSRYGSGRVWSDRVESGRVGSGRVGSVGSRGFEISRFGSGRVKEALKYHASDRVGSRGFEISRVGSDRVATREIRVTSRVRPQ